MNLIESRMLLAGAALAGILACGGHTAPGPGASSPSVGPAARTAPIIADHTAVAAFDSIPPEYIERAKDEVDVHYTHTSHGSQLVTGMDMLEAERDLFDVPSGFLTEAYGDLGQNGSLDWVDKAHEAAGDYDVVMWSWCGGVAKSTRDPVEPYLRAMQDLEREYPEVTFVYMTGHVDKWRVDELRERNQRIRDFCEKNDKVLYDFADIESWDLAGTFHEDAGDDCAWCKDHCASNPCPSCEECAHSHCLNCYIKGKAFWWMMARLAGWTPSG